MRRCQRLPEVNAPRWPGATTHSSIKERAHFEIMVSGRILAWMASMRPVPVSREEDGIDGGRNAF
jgi:hypothetical protein